MSSKDLSPNIARLTETLPEWLRHDLASKEPAIRARAEESLAAMIIALLAS